MQTVQVPVWVAVVVTLGVALIGAAGPVVAQYVSAWRERRSEDIRWGRDRVIESMKISHEHAANWREHRMRTYAELVRCVEAARQVIDRFISSRVNIKRHVSDFEAEYVDARRQLMQTRDTALLFCEEEIRKILEHVDLRLAINMPVHYFRDLVRDRGRIESAQSDDVIEAWESSFSQSVALLENYQDVLTAAIRIELGVDRPKMDVL